MEEVINNNEVKRALQQQLNQMVEENEKQYNDLIAYIENEKKQIEIMKNKTREKKSSINRITHEIEANTVLVTELKESVMVGGKTSWRPRQLPIYPQKHNYTCASMLVTPPQEEEKKLDEYPKLIEEINEQLNLILKNFDSSKLEYNTVKLHKDYIQNEWKRKLSTLYNLLGFEIILQDDKIAIEFSNIQPGDPQKKYRATVALHNGTYEAIETAPRLNKFDDYVNGLNKGLPFTTFCCLLRKSFKELK